jgi:hypothetical protein
VGIAARGTREGGLAGKQALPTHQLAQHCYCPRPCPLAFRPSPPQWRRRRSSRGRGQCLRTWPGCLGWGGGWEGGQGVGTGQDGGLRGHSHAARGRAVQLFAFWLPLSCRHASQPAGQPPACPTTQALTRVHGGPLPAGGAKPPPVPHPSPPVTCAAGPPAAPCTLPAWTGSPPGGASSCSGGAPGRRVVMARPKGGGVLVRRGQPPLRCRGNLPLPLPLPCRPPPQPRHSHVTRVRHDHHGGLLLPRRDLVEVHRCVKRDHAHQRVVAALDGVQDLPGARQAGDDGCGESRREMSAGGAAGHGQQPGIAPLPSGTPPTSTLRARYQRGRGRVGPLPARVITYCGRSVMRMFLRTMKPRALPTHPTHPTPRGPTPAPPAPRIGTPPRSRRCRAPRWRRR